MQHRLNRKNKTPVQRRWALRTVTHQYTLKTTSAPVNPNPKPQKQDPSPAQVGLPHGDPPVREQVERGTDALAASAAQHAAQHAHHAVPCTCRTMATQVPAGEAVRVRKRTAGRKHKHGTEHRRR